MSASKDGDRNDCYAVFSRLVQRGELPEDWESLQRELDAGTGRPSFNPTAGCRCCAGSTGPWLRGVGAGQPQGLLPPQLAQRLSGHQGIVQLAIEGLGHPPQGGEPDGVSRLGLLQLAQPRRRDCQALAQLGGSHAQGFADGPQPAHRRSWRQGVAGRRPEEAHPADRGGAPWRSSGKGE